MTPLNSRLQLAFLSRKKAQNAIEKGFTLVELMIVIVIVGVLSAVALPNFLGQQTKAKVTEATSKISSILKASHAEYTYSGSDVDAATTALTESANSDKAGVWTYTPSTVAGTAITSTAVAAPTFKLTPNNILIVSATPNTTLTTPSQKKDDQLASAAGGNFIYGCINLETGEVDVAREFKTSVESQVNDTAGTATEAVLDCV